MKGAESEDSELEKACPAPAPGELNVLSLKGCEGCGGTQGLTPRGTYRCTLTSLSFRLFPSRGGIVRPSKPGEVDEASHDYLVPSWGWKMVSFLPSLTNTGWNTVLRGVVRVGKA